MKKTALTALIASLAFVSFAQEKSKKIDITWGEEQKESRRTTLSDVVAYDKTGICALKAKAKGLLGMQMFIEHYDQQMNLTKSVEFAIEQGEQKRGLEFVLQHNDKIYAFSSFANQKLKKNFLFYQTMNKKTLQPNSDVKKLAEIDYSGKGKYNSGGFDYEISRDSSKIMIYYALPYEKGENEKFGFHVFDKDFNLLWEKDITLPYKDELFDVEGYEVDNSGNVHLLGLIYKDKRKEKRKGEPNYKYQILSYRNEGKELKEYPVNIPGKFLTDMQIAVNDDQDLICGGFYSKEGTFSIIGSYFLKIDDESQKIKTQSFKEFGIDFITQNMTERQEKKTKKKAAKGKSVELYEYDLDDILLRKDGGAVLIGEQFYIRVVTTTTYNPNGGTSTTTTYYYNYNDIIAINISPEGTIEWTEKIPKRQVTTNDGGFYSSYAMAIINDKMYFIFNDNPKNLLYKAGDKLYNFNKSKESLAVLVELDSEGNQTREALFSARDAGLLIRPMVCEQISGNEVVLFGQRGKKQRFAKLEFK